MFVHFAATVQYALPDVKIGMDARIMLFDRGGMRQEEPVSTAEEVVAGSLGGEGERQRTPTSCAY